MVKFKVRNELNCKKLSERGVTANIPVLGTGDSGFESRRSDHIESKIFASARLMLK